MLGGYRHSLRAAGRCVTGLLLALVLIAAQGPPQGAAISETNPAENARSPVAEGNTKQAQPQAPSQQDQADVRATQERERRADERDEQDLIAQQRMADAAEGLEEITWLQFYIGVAGLILLGLATVFACLAWLAAKRGAIAGEKAVEEAQKSTDKTIYHMAKHSRRELRAYISVEPAAINQLINSEMGMGHVIVQNVGKIPARNVSINVQMKLSESREITDFSVPADTNSITRVIQPGTGMQQGSSQTIAADEIASSGKYVFVWGVVHYEDGFGKRRFTRFCHRYPTASYDRRVNWKGKPMETRPILEATKARYHTHGNEAD